MTNYKLIRVTWNIERQYEREMMLKYPEWNNDGVIRRKCRQLLREFAKTNKAEYGRRSVWTYLDYVRNHRDRTGGLEC